MTDRQALELECQLRFIEFAGSMPPDEAPDEPIDLYIRGYWDGVAAAAAPRSASDLRNALEMRRRAAGLIK